MKSQDNKYLVLMGNNIRDIRKSQNMSQEELAFKAEIDRSYVGGIERGERNVSFLTLVKLAKCLNSKILDFTKDIPNDK